MYSTGERSLGTKAIVLSERWRRYRADGEREVRDQLVLAYSPLVKHVAGGICSKMPAHVDLADLISYGLGGLIDAVERYDPDRGVRFESFASLRIRGAIFDQLRSLDWVPRAVRDEGRGIQAATSALLIRLQRLPDEAELAAALGIDDAELAKRLQRVANSHMVALDEPSNPASPGGGERSKLDLLPDDDAVDPSAIAETDETQERAAAAVLQLTAREQTILALRYHQELNFAEIGEVFQLTESRISQIHAKSLIQLRAIIEAPDAIVA
jgi:RNA polymerase sigma factor for flagellar operon FliA